MFFENGDLQTLEHYVTADGYALGSWPTTQRLACEGRVGGNLTEEQTKTSDVTGKHGSSVEPTRIRRESNHPSNDGNI